MLWLIKRITLLVTFLLEGYNVYFIYSFVSFEQYSLTTSEFHNPLISANLGIAGFLVNSFTALSFGQGDSY